MKWMHHDPGLVGRFVCILVDVKHPISGAVRGISCGYFLSFGNGIVPQTYFHPMN